MSTFAVTPKGDLVVCLSLAEARGLCALAGQGARSLFAEPASALDVIGHQRAQDAARRSLATLGDAIAAAIKGSN